eukprot:XP_019918796.1 PREDICTED: uncharacterized protein LOC105318270 isoform X5 [Crassostrea gigas]
MNEMEERVLTRRQRSFLREMEERKSMHGGALRLDLESEAQASTKIQKEMEGRASVSLRKQKTIQRNIGEQASDSTRKQRSLRKEMRDNESTLEGAQRVEVENPASVSTRTQRSSQREREEQEVSPVWTYILSSRVNRSRLNYQVLRNSLKPEEY